MNSPIQLTNTIPSIRGLIIHLHWPCNLGPIAFPLVLAWFAFSPQARAVCQEGCLTNANTVLGEDALSHNTTGSGNAAIGFNALDSNTTGNANTAIGFDALVLNTTGSQNTAIGNDALLGNSTGEDNTATGFLALQFNTTGVQNTATGSIALNSNTTGSENTANGMIALRFNTTGNANTATGLAALLLNTTGFDNTATGAFALDSNTTGHNNIALGVGAGGRLTTGSHNIYIGNAGSGGGESGKIRIGTVGMQNRTFIAGISGANVPDGVGVIVGSDGRLGTVVSSARFKDSIKPMDKASEAILSLQPVTFRYKHELDPDGVPQFGLVAEQVEKVNPDLVARDDQGKPYTVRYEAVNAMLLNEFLKEHRKVQTLEASLAQVERDSSARAARQQSEIDLLSAALKAQAAQIQKVSDQLRAQAPAPRVVTNN